jgi:hypothetical protein
MKILNVSCKPTNGYQSKNDPKETLLAYKI